MAITPVPVSVRKVHIYEILNRTRLESLLAVTALASGEVIALLEQKTRGNLTAEEREVLGQVLYQLRLRFVEANGGGKKLIIEP